MENAATTQFVVEDPANLDLPQTIRRIAGVDVYLVEYTDKAGSKVVRLCFQIPGSTAVFMLADKVGDARVVSPTSDWFQNEFMRVLKASRPVMGDQF